MLSGQDQLRRRQVVEAGSSPWHSGDVPPRRPTSHRVRCPVEDCAKQFVDTARRTAEEWCDLHQDDHLEDRHGAPKSQAKITEGAESIAAASASAGGG